MRRRVPVGQEVGVDLLLAGGDAFGHLADQLAVAYQRWSVAGEAPAVLEWAQRMAEFAGWWAGRLEGEADHLVGFGGETGSPVNSTGQVSPRPGAAWPLQGRGGSSGSACDRPRRPRRG
jgi:hypothetical protein